MEKVKILAIEDSKLCAEILSKKLSDKFDLRFSHSLSDGLKALEGTRFDVVLLDLGLHDCNKETVMDVVMGKSGGAAIIILTGHADPRLRNLMLLKHADGFAVKGVEDSPEDIEWIIQQAIQHRKRQP